MTTDHAFKQWLAEQGVTLNSIETFSELLTQQKASEEQSKKQGLRERWQLLITGLEAEYKTVQTDHQFKTGQLRSTRQELQDLGINVDQLLKSSQSGQEHD